MTDESDSMVCNIESNPCPIAHSQSRASFHSDQWFGYCLVYRGRGDGVEEPRTIAPRSFHWPIHHHRLSIDSCRAIVELDLLTRCEWSCRLMPKRRIFHRERTRPNRPSLYARWMEPWGVDQFSRPKVERCCRRSQRRWSCHHVRTQQSGRSMCVLWMDREPIDLLSHSKCESLRILILLRRVFRHVKTSQNRCKRSLLIRSSYVLFRHPRSEIRSVK